MFYAKLKRDCIIINWCYFIFGMAKTMYNQKNKTKTKEKITKNKKEKKKKESLSKKEKKTERLSRQHSGCKFSVDMERETLIK